jgi:hypothetical protein
MFDKSTGKRKKQEARKLTIVKYGGIIYYIGHGTIRAVKRRHDTAMCRVFSLFCCMIHRRTGKGGDLIIVP